MKNCFSVFQSFILILGLFLSLTVNAQDTRFTVVLDAGHGGHDPGAKTLNNREKDINLAVTLILGNIIEQNFRDVKVVYTRKTDVYLTLQERANVVNDHHADLFICVHTNSSPGSSAYGAESYTLGLAKTKANLDVAMRENSVITLEEDYKTKYHGFDPNSVDSYIMFEFMQDKYIDRSVDFASVIQKQFHKYCGRLDRGVRQAGFWVLHRSACPSVLVELGFISNPSEERYLISSDGQKELATAIFNAFVDYKRAHDKKSGRQIINVNKIEKKESSNNAKEKTDSIKPQNPVINVPTKTNVEKTKPEPIVKTTNKPNNKPVIDTLVDVSSIKPVLISKNAEKRNISALPVFKLQLFASNKVIKHSSVDFKGLSNVEYYIENGLYKYTVGSETDYSKIETLRKKIHNKFPKAFIIGFVDNKKMTNKELSKFIK
ncbi:MAG: N-acetylmuramoyl-L-alanine amidase [Paludibacter sp.]